MADQQFPNGNGGGGPPCPRSVEWPLVCPDRSIRLSLLLNELNHHVKNTLAIIQTLRGTDVSPGRRDAFVAKLIARAEALKILSTKNRDIAKFGTSLRIWAIVRSAGLRVEAGRRIGAKRGTRSRHSRRQS